MPDRRERALTPTGDRRVTGAGWSGPPAGCDSPTYRDSKNAEIAEIAETGGPQMRFEARQRFAATAAEVLDCYASPDTYQQLPEFGRISRPELLDHRRDGSCTVLRLRYRFTADLPAAATAVIDPDRLTWVEETTFDHSALRATVNLIPDHYRSKMEASATVGYRDLAEPTTSERVVSGNLRIRVLLVAGQVERAIVGGLEEHLAEEAVLVAQLLTH